MAKCRDCGHVVLWVTMRSGKRAPVAPAPDDRGTIVARKDRRGDWVDGIVRHLNITLDPDQRRFIHHRGVCTHPRALPAARPIPALADLTTPPQPTLI